METKEMSIEILNDLVQINNDRIAGYEHALKELSENDNDLRAIFIGIITESQKFRMELGTEVGAMGSDMETDTTTTGRIYRAWLDLKSVFSTTDRKSILESCEHAEDATQKAYRTALEDEELPAYLGEMITNQRQLLNISHRKIKELRDLAV